MRACKHAVMTIREISSAGTVVPPSGGGKGVKAPLQVRIPTDVKRRFKAHAAMRGLEPNELFVEVWNHYERTTKHADSGNAVL